MRKVMVVVVAAVVVVGCGGGGGGHSGTSRTLSCAFGGGICDAITAVVTDADQAALQTSCTTNGGTFQVGACSTTGAVAGHCHYAQSTISLPGAAVVGTMDEYYQTSDWLLADAQDYCATPPAGAWVP